LQEQGLGPVGGPGGGDGTAHGQGRDAVTAAPGEARQLGLTGEDARALDLTQGDELVVGGDADAQTLGTQDLEDLVEAMVDVGAQAVEVVLQDPAPGIDLDPQVGDLGGKVPEGLGEVAEACVEEPGQGLAGLGDAEQGAGVGAAACKAGGQGGDLNDQALPLQGLQGGPYPLVGAQAFAQEIEGGIPQEPAMGQEAAGLGVD